jgi:hypothetical protein
VKAKRRIVQRLSSQLKELALRSGGDAMLVFVQILLGQADKL